ncbi:MAG: TatD family hydrolase [Dehalococcoidales bacterium]|nr:TatD family hydrolase [Dehalococcoidales bacterium]
MKAEQLKGKIQTVLGVIEPEKIGITSCHEHILFDMVDVWRAPFPASERDLAFKRVTLENLGIVRANPAAIKDNMCQTDESLAIEEILRFKYAGGGTIVELSQNGLHRDPAGLARVARATGINIVMGSGYYIGITHPEDMDMRTEEEITNEVVRDILVGVGNTGIHAGIIGEIGSSYPCTSNEKKVLRACAHAQQRTGVPINIHPSLTEEGLLENISTLKDAGADLTHVAISHVDGYDYTLDTQRKVLEAGCYIVYDGCGNVVYPFSYMGQMINVDSDVHRINKIRKLIEHGFINQILLGGDICFKCLLSAYGGFGYAHIINNLIPLMHAKGMTEEQVNILTIDNPTRFLQFKSVT